MKVSPAGRKFIEEFEGAANKAYWDSLGHVWTIGFGHTDAAGPPKVTPHMVITPDEADTILASDLASVEANINHHVTATINQNQFDALASFDFNTGGLVRSGLLHAINNHLPVTEGLFTAWSHAGGKFVQGLYRRRVGEWKVYMASISNAVA